ncbi:MAG: WD40/YVTN/BNR-like repeat-containing protein [Gemmatimonadales bacterium]
MRFAALAAIFVSTAAAAQVPEQVFGAMRYRPIGPFRGGRALAVSGVRGRPLTFYFGAVAGGVFRTDDGGATWTPLFDDQPNLSIGALAVADSDPNVIYVGTGEACIRGNVTYGKGVYRSDDAGRSWRSLGLQDTRQIGRIAVHPRNADIAFVAALGHAFGPNAERGVFRTLNGGRTWEKVLFRDADTGAIDVALDPQDPQVVFASLWQVRRYPWSLVSGGPGSGLYRSRDGGSTWTRLTGHGLPSGDYGRIGIAVSPADGRRVYAVIEAKEGGLFVSDDAGESWTRANDDERVRQRAWYFSHVWADPRSRDTVYLSNTGVYRSTDAGKTLTLLPARHGDHHGMWIDPDEPRRIIESSDGGASISLDGGQTWSRTNSQPTAQFYHVAVDNDFPYRLYGAQQDNSSVAVQSRSDSGVIGDHEWYPIGIGEAAYIAPDPRDPNIAYGSSSAGAMLKYDHHTEQTQILGPWPVETSGRGADELKHRFQWLTPLTLSPHDPNVIYAGAEVVFKSADGGITWSAISPDLTRNDKSRQKPSGGPLTLDITSVEYFDTIFALAESPVQKGVLWAGTDDGLVHVLRAGKWHNVTPKALPEWGTVSLIDASPFAAGTATVAVDRHRMDDLHAYVFRTTDFGGSWKRIDGGIPDGAFVRAVREDPRKQGLLYAGTEAGVYVSFDTGVHWQPLKLNLPVVPVHDLLVKGDDLVIATHGRSFWILDDVTPLRQASAAIASQDVHLFQPQTALRLQYPEAFDKRLPAGENPPPGALIDYFLKSKPKGEVRIQVLAADGKVVRTLSSRVHKVGAEQPQEWPDIQKPPELLPDGAGMNRFPWDLRYDAPSELPGAFYPGLPPRGPVVAPGVYTLRLEVDGRSATTTMEVKPDPRVKTTPAAFAQLLALQLQVRDRMSTLHEGVLSIRDARDQLAALQKRAGKDSRFAPLVTRAGNAIGQLTEIERKLVAVDVKSTEGTLRFPVQLNEQFESLRELLEFADAAPVPAVSEVFAEYDSALQTQLGKWRDLRTSELSAINVDARRLDLPAVTLPQEPGATRVGGGL